MRYARSWGVLFGPRDAIENKQPVIDFVVTAPYTYRWLEEITEENASTTTSPSAAIRGTTVKINNTLTGSRKSFE